jgi:hypothetical protein
MSKIFLYGFNKNSPIIIHQIDCKAKNRNYSHHLKNIAANNNVVSLSSVQLNEKSSVFVILDKKYHVNNKWINYHNAKNSYYKAYNNPAILDYS